MLWLESFGGRATINIALHLGNRDNYLKMIKIQNSKKFVSNNYELLYESNKMLDWVLAWVGLIPCFKLCIQQ